MFKLRLSLPTKTSLCLSKHMATRPERATAREHDYVENERGSSKRERESKSERELGEQNVALQTNRRATVGAVRENIKI